MNTTEPDRLTLRDIVGIAALAVVGSAVAGVAVFIAVRARRTMPASTGIQSADSTAVQPAIATSTAAALPHHFSEDLVVPGFTLTGQETIQQDNTLGRSPEGV